MDEQHWKMIAVAVCAAVLRGAGYDRTEAVVEAIALTEQAERATRPRQEGRDATF